MLRVSLRRDAASWSDVEADGLEWVDDSLAERVARLFHGPALAAMFVTIAAVLLPGILATYAW